MYNINEASPDMEIISEDGQIVNIWVCQQLTFSKIHASRVTSSLDDNATLNADLFMTYNYYMNQH